MIKTGITTIQSLCSKNETFFRKEQKNVSITLYDQILEKPNGEELAERILLLFADERGAYKRTYGKRFEAFDHAAADILQKHFDTQSALLLHDVGISDGRTSADFFESVSAIFSNLNFIASDYNPKVYVLEKGKLKVTISHTQKVLEITMAPFVLNAAKRDSYRHYPINLLVRLFLQQFIVPLLLKAHKLNTLKIKELLLFSPRALNLAKADQRFMLTQHDLLQPLKQQNHAIRAMNVLNPSYFSTDEFSRVISNIYNGLLENGLFITGSNQEAGSVVHGGIYKKTNNRFEKIWQSGDGSPIENQILQWKN